MTEVRFPVNISLAINKGWIAADPYQSQLSRPCGSNRVTHTGRVALHFQSRTGRGGATAIH